MQEINKNEITLLWHLGFHDSYLSGIAKYQDQYVYINCIEENDLYYQQMMEEVEEITEWFRKFHVIELSAEQLDFELTKHKDFETFVGTHTNYDKNGKRSNGALQPREKWDLFYKKYQNCKTDYSQNKVIGFFLD